MSFKNVTKERKKELNVSVDTLATMDKCGRPQGLRYFNDVVV